MRALKVSEPKAKRSGSVRPVFTTGFLKPGPGPPRAYLGKSIIPQPIAPAPHPATDESQGAGRNKVRGCCCSGRVRARLRSSPVALVRSAGAG
jgi:hypothetical protein